MKIRISFAVAALAVILWAQSPLTVTQTITLTPKVDVFQNQNQQFALAGTPAQDTSVMVFLNGLLMLQGVDYTLSGNVLTFTGQEIDGAPIVQVMYWEGVVVTRR